MSLENTLMRIPRYNHWNLSLSILLRDPLVRGVHNLMDRENANLLRAVLYKYGLDIKMNYDVEIIEHRNDYDEVVHCPFFTGIERRDERWKFIKEHVRTWDKH